MPAPAASMRRQVLLGLQTALRLILGNPTYHYTVLSTSVTTEPGPQITNISPTQLPYFVVEPMADGLRDHMPAGRVRNIMQCLITARVDAEQNPGSASQKMLAWENLIADIEVALTRDITLGGIVIDTRVLEPQPASDIGGGPMVIVVQPVQVRFIRPYGTP